MKQTTLELLENNGYKFWKETKESDCVKMQFQKRILKAEELGVPLCLCNDKVFVNIDHFSMVFHHQGHDPVSSSSFEISLCHERPNGEWCDFKIYSLTEEQIVSKLQKYEQDILAIWKLFYEQGERNGV